jgi:hypothetical protein
MEENHNLIYDLSHVIDSELILEELEEKYQCKRVDVSIAEVDNENEFIKVITITVPKKEEV